MTQPPAWSDRLPHLITIFVLGEVVTILSLPLSLLGWRNVTLKAGATRLTAVHLDGIGCVAQIGIDPVVAWCMVKDKCVMRVL